MMLRARCSIELETHECAMPGMELWGKTSTAFPEPELRVLFKDSNPGHYVYIPLVIAVENYMFFAILGLIQLFIYHHHQIFSWQHIFVQSSMPWME